jgi:hypothetical protein
MRGRMENSENNRIWRTEDGDGLWWRKRRKMEEDGVGGYKNINDDIE